MFELFLRLKPGTFPIFDPRLGTTYYTVPYEWIARLLTHNNGLDYQCMLGDDSLSYTDDDPIPFELRQ